MAINALYEKRLNAPGMRLNVETRGAKSRDVTPGVADAEVPT